MGSPDDHPEALAGSPSGSVRWWMRGPALWIAVIGLLVTLGLRTLLVAGDDDRWVAERSQLVGRGLDRAVADWNGMLLELQTVASSVSRNRAIVEGMRALSEEGPRTLERTVEAAVALDLPEMVSVEIYDQTPKLVAWKGVAMPMDEGPADERFLASPFFELAVDLDRRTALVLWMPIQDEEAVIGVVRALRMIETRYPVRNEYLRDYSLAYDWSRATGLDFRVTLGSQPAVVGPDMVTRNLVVPDGRHFGVAVVTPPTLSETALRLRGRYDAVLAFWAALLVLLGLGFIARHTTTGTIGPIPFFVAAIAARFAWLLLNVPGRWQTGKAPLSPLFDPEHMASSWGFGLFGSIGELAVTALLTIFVVRVFSVIGVRAESNPRSSPRWVLGLSSAAATLSSTVLFVIVETATRRILNDSTLDYFERSGLLPQRLVVVVFASLLLILLSAWVAGAVSWRVLVRTRFGVVDGAAAGRNDRRHRYGAAILGAVLVLGASLAIPHLRDGTLFAGLVFFVGGCAGYGLATYDAQRRPLEYLTARGVLSTVVVLALVLYPALDRGLATERRERMIDAAESFGEDRDPRVIFALERALDEIGANIDLQPFDSRRAVVDSVLDQGLLKSLLTSLGTYEVSAVALNRDGEVLGRTGGVRTPGAMAALDARDQDDLDLLLSDAFVPDENGRVVDRLTSPRERDRFDYVGIAPLPTRGDFVLVRAAQHEHLPAGNTPFPRVLVPAGYYGNQYSDLSIAEFRDDVLVRSFGAEFGRSYLDRAVSTELLRDGSAWRQENVGGRPYLTYYALRPEDSDYSPMGDRRTLAVRQASVSIFDRLYYLLRLTVSGLLLGLPVYLVGLVLRRRAGVLPERRVRFRDKVLNAFFGVGLVAITAMGALGLRVVTGENERAIEGWLRQHLERVEEALAQGSGVDELPYRGLERVEIDSLAARVGLDLSVYRGFELESTSRPQLFRDRLIPTRIPIEAYRALFVDGFRFTDVDERLGRFEYTAGYRALVDEQGVPRYVVAIPTLPEQERLEEERARTVAYLFGALLLLVLLVMATAAVIANALSLPLARLRRGLELVSQGRFERIRPVESRDELGELVTTFNTMQDQLAESRRLLAQHERQLAWREMARQVAHEIKNPLTPMKLSVQHLQRAYEDGAEGEKFRKLFESVTASLVDQADALARIANEFSTFARMPLQKLEPFDLNSVAAGAVSLMQEQTSARIEVLLHPEPLVIEADREALQRVFINFIKNAVEALESERKGRLSLSTRSLADEETGIVWAYAEVADNGMGVPDDLRDKIFTPAFSTKTSGTGLGLAISRNTVEELRGRIGFESEVGKGSVFWIRIPLMTDEVA